MQLYQLSFPNGKKYIGITSKTAKQRFVSHCAPANRKNPVQHAIHKYGKENVVITVLATVDHWELLCLAEIEAIEKYNTFAPNGYNLTMGGEGSLKINLFGNERNERDKEERKKYRQENELAIKLYAKEYRELNFDKLKDGSLVSREKRKEKIKEYRKQYDRNNRDRLYKQHNDRRNANLSLANDKARKYIAANKEKKAEWDKKYREANKEYLAKKAKENGVEYRKKNKEIIAEKYKIYSKNNRSLSAERQRRYRLRNKESINEKKRINRRMEKISSNQMDIFGLI